jgi:DNA (cytosine-5)-methyltransferase 1
MVAGPQGVSATKGGRSSADASAAHPLALDADMPAYYNENDPFAAAWLRELIGWKFIASGDVDTRSIEDVTPDDLRGYTQHHFFAGIGVWSAALRRAGWPDDRPIWTGSCPCQPFSTAGKGGGFADERHLWPTWFWLLEQHHPPTIVGEQVSSKPGLGWFDLVSADLEGAGYAVGAADMGAASVGAPHIRQRLWWVAHDDGSESGAQPGNPGEVGSLSEAQRQPEHSAAVPGRGCGDGRVAHDNPTGQHRVTDLGLRNAELYDADRRSAAGSLAGGGHPGPLQHASGDGRIERGSEPSGRSTAGFWREADWIPCRDGKWRPVEPGTFPLAHGATARVGRLRGYGNALCLPVAQAFIEAVMTCASLGS